MRCVSFDAAIHQRKNVVVAARRYRWRDRAGVSRHVNPAQTHRATGLDAAGLGRVNKIFSSTIDRNGTFSDRMTQHPMAWIERFTCDVCGKQQMTVDEKWWIAVNECAASLDSNSGQPTLKLMPWDNALAHSAESKHLCGAGCAHTFMDRWMAGFRAGTETCVDVSTSS